MNKLRIIEPMWYQVFINIYGSLYIKCTIYDRCNVWYELVNDN